jgi:prevent-host-death family protein
MITVNTHEAKTKLSALLAAVEEKHETVLICRNGKAVAQLVHLAATRDRLKPRPSLRVALHYDPTEPLSENEIPSDYR